MPNYRRAFVPGGCLVLHRQPAGPPEQPLLTDEIACVCAKPPGGPKPRSTHFYIDAMVVLPDHMHAVWSLPPEDAEFFNALAPAQVVFRQVEAHEGRAARVSVRQARGERGIWQRRILGAPDPRRAGLFPSHSSTATSIPMKHGRSSCGYEIGRISRSGVTWRAGFFRKIGPESRNC